MQPGDPLYSPARLCRRLRSVEPEDKRFVMRWWTDLGFLMVTLLRLCRAAHLPATDLLPIRRPLLPLRSQEAGESPQTQAKRTTPIPRAFGGFRLPLLTFAKH
jgi:hypothetical protein